ncbi:YeiH family protein [Neobacillus sp. Marseille-QA0830]
MSGETARALRSDDQHINQSKSKTSVGLWVGGMGFTFAFAAAGYVLGMLPGLNRVGPLACSILLAVVYRQLGGYPDKLRAGIEFSARYFLRFAIILYGLKLNMGVIFSQGFGLVLRDAGVIAFAILATVWLGKWLKADFSLSLLLGIGTGVCGAAAIAAAAPIMKAKEEDTAMGVGIIALVGTIFSITYTIIRPLLPLSAVEYGIWSGSSLHEIAHVALAGAPAGPDGLAMALLAKLGRVLLLVPLCFILMYWMKRKNAGALEANKVEFPWFLVGFILMSLVGSYGLGHWIPVTEGFQNGISTVTSFILSSAMVGLGLKVSLRDLRTKALRPLLAMLITSFLLSVITYLFL